MGSKYKLHKLALLFPEMAEADFNKLKEDIKQNGLLDPITLFEDKILDGRHRYQACEELGIKPAFVEYNGDSPATFVASKNSARRHLTASQRAAIALNFKPFFAKEAKARQGKKADISLRAKMHEGNITTNEQAGKSIGVSARYVAEAERIRKETPEVYEEICRGETTISAATKKAHVGQSTGENEWYTPTEYIEAARKTMGSIDLDPASTAQANKVVKAKTFYTKENDGLVQKWQGNVWLNPPYAQPLIRKFIDLLVDRVDSANQGGAPRPVAGEMDQAIVMVNNATETKWFQKMLKRCDVICFPGRRIKFLDPQGIPGDPLQGQAILYFGYNIDQFEKEFSKFGHIVYGKG